MLSDNSQKVRLWYWLGSSLVYLCGYESYKIVNKGRVSKFYEVITQDFYTGHQLPSTIRMSKLVPFNLKAYEEKHMSFP